VKAVIDASSLIILAKAKALEDLFAIYGPVAVTDAVFEEVVVEGKKRGKTDAWLIETALEKGWLVRISLPPEEEALARNYRARFSALGLGECETIACAEKRGLLLLIEERKAKALAKLKGLRYTIAQTVPVEGYLMGKIAYERAIALLEHIAVAMNTDLAVLNALKAMLTALEEERAKGDVHG